MANSSNLVLQLLITARDQASSVFAAIFSTISAGFSALNDATNVLAGQIRSAFSTLFGGALESAAGFEQQLSKVIAKGDETYANTEALKAGLRDVAAQFGVTGTQAAEGMEVLAAAGLNATDAMKALPSVMAIATMENLSLGDAATKLSDTLSIMGMDFSEAGRMADVLSKASGVTTSSVVQLSEAMTTAGGSALAAGMDLETTVAALDMLHKGGIKGNEAGTSLAAILLQLQNPASKASEELGKLGIHSRDLGTVLDGLQAAGVKNGAAIRAFGETAGPGLQAMLTQGSKGLNDFREQINQAGGSSQEAARRNWR